MNMINNLNNKFVLGQVEPGLVKITLDGKLAIKVSGDRFLTFDTKSNTLTDVTGFTLDIGDNAIFAVPCNKVTKGDIVLIAGKPKCVINQEGDSIEVMDYDTQQIIKVIPERHMFLGKSVFITKIVSAFSGGNSKDAMKYMMVNSMLNNNTGNNQMNSILPYMMLNNTGAFNNMFSGMFDNDEDSDEDEYEYIKVKKTPKKAKAKKVKKVTKTVKGDESDGIEIE